MGRRIRKSLFGYKPSDVEDEIRQIDEDRQFKISALQLEIEKKKEELKKAEEEIQEFQKKINVFAKREHSIAEVFLEAQKRATQIEEEARTTARRLLEETENELRKRNQELITMREKVALFKDDFKKVLDKYRFSMETMTADNLSGDVSFPKLVFEKNDRNIERK
ncbi:MAG: DivIVA domain-containing protein [Bacillota bacterium]|nr:DivIVA domain-containing protein [Bacillota bacterium]